MRRIGSIAGALLKSLPGDTPAAVVQWAGGADERRLLTRLDRLAADATNAGFACPAVILVGSAIGESIERMRIEGDGRRAEGGFMRADEPLAHEAIAHAA